MTKPVNQSGYNPDAETPEFAGEVTEPVVIETAPEVVVDAEAGVIERIEPVISKTITKAIKEKPKLSYANSSLLEWPTDQWGFMAELKRAMTNVASRINGAADKKELFDQTLAVGIRHIEARYADNK